jgi:hypothetical protein
MNNFKVVEFRNMKNYMSKFVSQNTFIKIYISIFDKYFYKNKKSKLCFGDRVAGLSVKFFFSIEGVSGNTSHCSENYSIRLFTR